MSARRSIATAAVIAAVCGLAACGSAASVKADGDRPGSVATPSAANTVKTPTSGTDETQGASSTSNGTDCNLVSPGDLEKITGLSLTSAASKESKDAFYAHDCLYRSADNKVLLNIGVMRPFDGQPKDQIWETTQTSMGSLPHEEARMSGADELLRINSRSWYWAYLKNSGTVVEVFDDGHTGELSDDEIRRILRAVINNVS